MVGIPIGIKDRIHLNNVDVNQAFSKDNGYSIFSFNIDWYELDLINETFRAFASVNEIINRRKVFSNNVNAILNTIENCNIQSFLLFHDDGDICALIVKDRQIYQEKDWDSIEDILNYFTEPNNSIDFNKY